MLRSYLRKWFWPLGCGTTRKHRRTNGASSPPGTLSPEWFFIEPLESRCLLTVVDLASLGQAGTVVSGADEASQTGYAVELIGDVNQDGYDDFAVSAVNASPHRELQPLAGKVYLIMGGPLLPERIDLAAPDADVTAVTILGDDAEDETGFSVSGTGDVNGDGYDDLLIGSRNGDGLENLRQDAGEVYLIYGSATLPSEIDLRTSTSPVTKIGGARIMDRAGRSVGRAGDLNGDGFDDLILGATRSEGPHGVISNVGTTYVIFGGVTLPAALDLAAPDTADVTLVGVDMGDLSGFSVNGAGDLNGDGFDDLAIGAKFADGYENQHPDAGEVYVVFGGAELPPLIELQNLQAGGMTIYGIDAGDLSGFSVAAAGDVNGDGLDDLLIGTRFADGPDNMRNASGEAYLIYGSESLPGQLFLSGPGQWGITVHGANAGDQAGLSVSGAGDFNGDGFDDILIGSNSASSPDGTRAYAGRSTLVLGGAGLPQVIDLAELTIPHLSFVGATPFDLSGFAVSGGRDVNGDGFDDILIGAPAPNILQPEVRRTGSAVIIPGHPVSWPDAIVGDRDHNVLTATGETRALIGGQGNDTLSAAEATEVLRGGQGDDILEITGADWSRLRRVSGGLGTDTLKLTASGGQLDLTVPEADRLDGIEVIDLRGHGPQTLIIHRESVLRLNSTRTLTILADDEDRIECLGEWLDNGVVSDENLVYHSFQNGNAEVRRLQAPVQPALINGLLVINDTSGVNHRIRVAMTESGDSYVVTALSPVPGLPDFDFEFPVSEPVRGLIADLGAGSDWIDLSGTPLPATVSGGSGADTLIGGIAADSLDGGEGHDLLTGGPGDNTISGGNGVDTLVETQDASMHLSGDSTAATLSMTLWNGTGTGTLTSIEAAHLRGGTSHNRIDASQWYSSLTTTLIGGGGRDTVIGSPGDDRIITFSSGRDLIHGGAGNDSISSGNGDDTVDGGDGVDTIQGQGGNDSIIGGDGEDTLIGNDGDDNLIGGDGDDILIGNDGDDTALGMDGHDKLFGMNGHDLLDGGHGNDSLHGASGDDTLLGGPGRDLLRGDTGQDSMDGGQGIDRVDEVVQGHVVITGVQFQYADRETETPIGIERIMLTSSQIGGVFINARRASVDVLLTGNDGDDTLIGGSGNDTVRGNSGDDVLSGGSGTDAIDGGAGTDTWYESADTDFTVDGLRVVSGSTGDETGLSIEQIAIQGGAGNNLIDATGATAAVRLLGGPGNDTLLGGSFDDTLTGGFRNDSTLPGSDGIDSLNGGAGADFLKDDPSDILSDTAGATLLPDIFSLLPEWLDLI